MAVNVGEILGNVSSTLIGAFGDKVLIGVMIRMLGETTPGMCYQIICRNGSMYDTTTEADWQKWRNMMGKTKMIEITTERVSHELTKHRPDIAWIIVNTAGGNEWLDAQVKFAKMKLGL